MVFQLPKFSAIDGLDILICTLLVWQLINLIRGTRVVPILQGLVIILLITLASYALKLKTLYWLLSNALTVILIALPIVFQPELRRGLEQLGSGRLIKSQLSKLEKEDITKMVDELVDTATSLSLSKVGGLIVIEREVILEELIKTGTYLDSDISSHLLLTIFTPKTPLHDGAVIIRGKKIVAASCYLPLTERPDLDKQLGTRHRAAIGLSEQADSVILLVSEETGGISVAYNGKLTRNLNEDSLRRLLLALCQLPTQVENIPFWLRILGRGKYAAKPTKLLKKEP